MAKAQKSEDQEKSKYYSILWKIGSTFAAILMLGFLYKKNIIAFAFVNGEAISLTDTIQLIRTGYSPQVFDAFMTEKLVEIEARKRGIIVSKEEIEKDIRRIEEDLALQGKTLTEVLVNSDQSLEDFQRNVKFHLTVYKLLSDNVEITPEEVDKYIKENDYIFSSPKERVEVEKEVEELLFKEKLSAEYDKWIRDVKAGSEIDYLVHF